MTGLIRVRLQRDDYGTGELIVVAAANGFSGIGSAWFNLDELEIFASQLTSYPLAEPGPAIAGGYYSAEAAVLSEELVGVTTYRVGATGQLGMQVRLATGSMGTTRPTSRHSVQLEVLTTYERLGRFAQELRALIRGDVTEAVLEGEELG
jgi:hypothetical protein